MDTPAPREILTFEAKISPKTKGEDGTFRATVMTQSRISNHFRMPDGTYVDELLLMSGAQLPKGGNVPLIDNHDYSSVRSILGSVQLSIGDDDDCDCDDEDEDCDCGETMYGQLSIDPSETDVQAKVQNGTINGVSVGMSKPNPKYVKFIAEGKKKTYDDEEYSGPLVVYEKWEPIEVSLTGFPANENAKIQLSLLNTFKQEDDEQPIPAGDPMSEDTKVDLKEGVKLSETKPTEAAPAVDHEKLVADALKNQKRFFSQVREECARHDLGDAADELTDKFSTIEDVRKALLDKIAERQKDTRPQVSVVSEGRERQFAAQNDALFFTMLANASLDKPTTFEKHAPKNIDENFVGMGLAGHARLILEAQNKNVRFWTDGRCIQEALKFSEQSYITSGSLANLLSDNINKTAIVGYEDAVVTYDQVFKQLNSQNNLKNAYAIRLSGVGYWDVWVENTVPLQKTPFDSKQAIKMISWADHIPVPWHVLRNDDLGMLTELPLEMGRAARRTLNRECWMPVTSNQVMDEDSQVLFSNTYHGNDYTTTNPPSSAEVQNLQQLLSAQTDKDGSLISNTGHFLIVPPALERLGKITCGSQYDVFNQASGAGVAYLPNVYQSQLVPIVEPILGQNSNTYWYLFANKATSPVAYVFLAGEETPYIDSFIDPHTDGLIIKGRQTFGVAAYDYRRGVRHA